MFTGIIEKMGRVKEIISHGTNKSFWVESPLTQELKIDQSLSHNGVCLTVEEIKDGMYRVTAIEETILKTNLDNWQKESVINLERCMQLSGRLDGHIVQGHIDCTANCVEVFEKAGSWEYSFLYPKQFATFIIEKGSVTVNGISLTCFNVTDEIFSVAIIPYTFEHTNMSDLKKGDVVNIEWDVVGKYVQRIMEIKN